MANEDWVPKDEAGAGDSGWLDTANDFGRAVTNAATFGMGNRAKAYIESWKQPKTLSSLVTGAPGTYEEHLADQVQKSEQARERSPYASIAGDVYGSFAIPALGAETLAARTGAALLPALPRAAPVIGRAVGYGVTGGVTGAAQGAGNTYSGNLPDYVQNAAIGGALGTALGGAGGALFGARPRVSAAQVPTQAELYAAKNVGYNALGNSGARYEASALHDVANDVEQRLLADRYHWRDSPGTWRGIEEARGGGAPGQLNTGPNAIIDPGNIDFIVKGLNKIPKNERTLTDRESASIVKRALNDFVENPPAGAVLPGTEREAAIASTYARNARGDYGAYKRTQALNELISNAQNTAGATHSGLGLQAELRKGIRTFAKEKGGESPASKAGFIPEETDALRGYARGTNLTNMMRYGSNALGGGGGIGAPIAAAAYGTGGGIAGQYFKDEPGTAGAVGLLAPVLGTGLRLIGNRRANNEIQAMRDLIAQRSPLYNFRTSQSGTVPGGGAPTVAKTARDAIALELMKQTQPRIYVSPANSSDWQ
jgi:hypothetical protein